MFVTVPKQFADVFSVTIYTPTPLEQTDDTNVAML